MHTDIERACMYAYTNMCIRAYIHTCAYVHTYIHVHTCIHKYIFMSSKQTPKMAARAVKLDAQPQCKKHKANKPRKAVAQTKKRSTCYETRCQAATPTKKKRKNPQKKKKNRRTCCQTRCKAARFKTHNTRTKRAVSLLE